MSEPLTQERLAELRERRNWAAVNRVDAGDLFGEIDRLNDQIAKLQAFKDWVHARLDQAGVPREFPDGPHTREGSRIGDRMDWLTNQLDDLARRIYEAEEGV